MPSSRPDSMKARPRMAAASPRISRAYHGHQAMTMAMAACSSEGPSAAPMARASSSDGKARKMSTRRIRMSSTQPPMAPLKRPMGTPMSSAPTMTSTRRADRPPRAEEHAAEQTSRPTRSVPRRCSSLGRQECRQQVRGGARVVRVRRDPRCESGRRTTIEPDDERGHDEPGVAHGRSPAVRDHGPRPSRAWPCGPSSIVVIRSLGSTIGRTISTTRLASR